MATISKTRVDADANQKRRRRRSGGKFRRWWRRFRMENPLLAQVTVGFLSFCLLGMLLETLTGGGTGNGRGLHHSRMRRAKALLQMTAHRHDDTSGEEQEQEEPQGYDIREERRRRGKRHHQRRHGDDSNEEEEEEEEGDDNSHKGHKKRFHEKELGHMLDKLNEDIILNQNGGVRWIAPYLMLPPLPSGRQLQQNDDQEMTRGRHKMDAVNPRNVDSKSEFFKVRRRRGSVSMKWEEEFSELTSFEPPVDYVSHAYEYPELLWELPNVEQENYPAYPPLQKLGDLMKNWPQDNDFPGAHQRPIKEGLLHFNYSNPKELEMARKFRDAELPFKLYDVPEVTAATKKWTDAYVAENFDGGRGFFRGRGGGNGEGMMDRLFGTGNQGNNNDKDDSNLPPPPPASGMAQESPNNYFAFFSPNLWDITTMGLPPVRNNDWTFEHWSKHARYADATALNASLPHFYWQSGVPREERRLPKKEWTFISRDLPSFSSPTETFFVFQPEFQKGIQCRFGERGVVAATHYDSGRNMIAMVTGAKRYILAPPKECPSLGIVPWKFNAVFRHSLLNFGHINYLNMSPPGQPELDDGEEENDNGSSGNNNEAGDDIRRRKHGRKQKHWTGDHMSQVEREWMETAAESKAIETVLKAGEVLYIPSHWFHYIVSLQKSAQCNVRSGVDDEGTAAFGGKIDVKTCGRLTPQEAMNMRD